jgi:putative membrane protein insertion efficiency factor
VRRIAVALIRCYQVVVSPLLGQRCRFYPSCSSYALGAISSYGLRKGGWLAARRFARCHPWNPGGYDPVPSAADAAGTQRDPADQPRIDQNRTH